MYRSGDYSVICDKCGMRRYASECRLNWQNQFVCGGCYEPRHPQDFVTGIADDQSVPIPRPTVSQTMGQTTVLVAGAKNATQIILAAAGAAQISDEDSLGIVLDDGTVHWTCSDGDPVGGIVTLGSYLPGAAAAGNVVYLPSANSETFISATDVSAEDL